jgi:hypothetical protein
LPRLGPPALGEIYAYGFRNAHRLSWDTDGTMFANDIGMNHIEEINIIRNGGNYGWMAREGSGRTAAGAAAPRANSGALSELYPLPDDILDGRAKDGFSLSGRDLRPRRRAGDNRPGSRITAGSPRYAASMSLATFMAAASLRRTLPR